MRSTVLAALALLALAVPTVGHATDGAYDTARLRVPPLRLASLQDREDGRVRTLLPPTSSLLGEASGASDGSGGPAILRGALYGGAAGALIGLGIALIENDHYLRDIAIGAGAGIIVGGAFGAARSMSDRRPYPDGLSTLDRSPVLHGTNVTAIEGAF